MREEIWKAIKGLFYLERHYNVKSISFLQMHDDGYEIINPLFWYIPKKDRNKWIYYYVLCMNESLFWRTYIRWCRFKRFIKSL